MNMDKRACTPKKYVSKIVLYGTFSILLALFISIFFFVKASEEDRLKSLGDSIISNFREGLNYEMVELLSFSLALAEDGELKNALMLENESRGNDILSQITERFKKYTHLQTLRIQVFTPEFFIFARSWDKGYEGMPIWWFREDLTSLNKNKRPKVGMETGRLLTLKATVPIQSGDKIHGYIEVIKFIDEFAFKLRKKGIELFALMDEEYLIQAELMRNFPVVNRYVVSNQNFNEQYIDKIRMLDWENFIKKEFTYKNNILYLYEPMLNGRGKQIGLYLLCIPEDSFSMYEEERQNISFFTQFSDEDIANVVEVWENPHGSFRNDADKNIVNLLPKLNKEDKIEFEMEAKNVLKGYNKNELIDIILENKHNEQKQGDIQ